MNAFQAGLEDAEGSLAVAASLVQTIKGLIADLHEFSPLIDGNPEWSPRMRAAAQHGVAEVIVGFSTIAASIEQTAKVFREELAKKKSSP